jgi:hypothetical protein
LADPSDRGTSVQRLNSVNPLDPSDHGDIEGRVERAARRFDAYDRPLVFRQSPLAPPQLEAYLDAHGWRRFDETIVMTGAIDQSGHRWRYGSPAGA